MNTHTKHRPHPRRRGLGSQLLRVSLFSASVLAITGFVVADVVAAEPSLGSTPRSLAERALFAAADVPEVDDGGPALFAAAILLPDGAAPASSAPPPPPVAKKRSKKVAFGRFEGY